MDFDAKLKHIQIMFQKNFGLLTLTTKWVNYGSPFL